MAARPEDPAVVTVNSTGLATAVSNSRYLYNPGASQSNGRWREPPVPTGVIANSGPVAEHRWPIEVRQVVAEVVVTPAADTIWGFTPGSVTLAVEPFDANGHSAFQESPLHDHAQPIRFEWSSDNPAVVTVERYGSSRYRNDAVGLSEGTATITATALEFINSLGVGGSAEITVAIPDPGRPGYPIHGNYGGDPPEDLRRAMESAAATWSRVLAPTEAAPFVVRNRMGHFIWVGEWVAFESGDVLAPGLHLYVYVGEQGRAVAWASLVNLGGTSDVPMDPVGVIGWSEDYLASAEYPEMYRVALHEIGHVLGIGTGERWDKWVEVPERGTKPENAYFTDPRAIAVFDRMGGTDFPATTPKIPLTEDKAHWDWCTGLPDVMATIRPGGTVTELTMASLAEGYVYDPTTVPGLKLDSEVWNALGGCRDGQGGGGPALPGS